MTEKFKSLKILWIDAVDYRFEVEKRYQPLGIFYIISQVKQRFADIPIASKIINSNVLNEIKQFNPDITAISCVSQNYNLVKTYAQLAKAHGSIVVVGGVHISAIPVSLTKDMDAGVIGEGEITFGDLVELYLQKGAMPHEQLEHIPGLVYWGDDGALKYSPRREFIKELDSIAHPDRKMMNKITRFNILSSRGCPFHCTFCFSSRNWGNIRFFSPEYICEEIQRILSLEGDNKTIGFWDDLFTVKYSRLKKIYEILDENRLLGKFKFYCSIRSNMVKDDSVRLLKEMGCIGMGMGLESGNPDILRYLKGDDIGVDSHISAIECLKKYDIEVNASFIIGSPHETSGQIMDTYNFIKNHQIDIFDVYLLTPLPGTPIWDYAKSKGYVHDDMDWSVLNFRFGDNPERAIILSEKLTRSELIRFFRKFKMLRLIRLLRTIWKSPHLWKLPTIIRGTIKEKIEKLVSSRHSRV